jgi:LysR family transcriptional regulator, benzoate and cis,cis-muconate-responsive activator of ben and cat genes
MDVRQLRYFVAVAEERNIGRAAKRLSISQPPLTRQIQQLEQELGVALFTRTPRGVEPTEAGLTLLRDARAIQAMIESASERAHRAGKGQEGRLDIGVYGSALFDIMPRLLHRFRTDHPEVKIVLHSGQTPQQVVALKQGRVLAAFERLLPEDPAIAVHLVAREPLFVSLNEKHPLARRETINFAALKFEKLIVNSSPNSRITSKTMALFHQHGFEPYIAYESDDVIIAATLAASGDGVCLVPKSLINLKMPGLVYRPLKARGDATMELYCFHLKGEQSPLLTALLGTVRKFA